MKWKSHVSNLKKSCQRGLNLMKILSNHTWGADSITLLRIYRALIRSKLDYGSIVYGSAKATLLKSLNVIQYPAMRIALEAFCTSPVESLLAEAGEQPLDVRRDYLSLSYAARVAASKNHPSYRYTFSDHFQHIFEQKQNYPLPFYVKIAKVSDNHIDFPNILPLDLKIPPPWTLPITPCNTYLLNFPKYDTPSNFIKKSFAELVSKYQHFKHIYTDSSKTVEGVGAAVITDTTTYTYRLPSFSSIYSGEVFAILSALQYCRRSVGDHVIFTDSLSAVLGIQQLYPKNALLLLIKTELGKLLQDGKHIEIVWIPSHMGITGNERAYSEAREAISNPNCREIQRVPYQDVYLQIKELICDRWRQRWQSLYNNKLRAINPNLVTQNYRALTRRQQVLLTRLRIGHTKFTSHL
ncbi:uncharacterized protein [Leptinotarsa decemlineata]|uniref:uncharacterized protein n=1 Tax=Leptinotarsa decemlineata TaxID=7539 RepID=UPI003D30B113